MKNKFLNKNYFIKSLVLLLCSIHLINFQVSGQERKKDFPKDNEGDTLINSDCNATFTYFSDSLSGKVCFKPEFSANRQLNYLWQFGDNTTSIDTDACHQYSKGGKYEVCLTVFQKDSKDTLNGCYATYCDWIIIDNPDTVPPSQCQANFKYSVSGDTLVLSDLSTGNPSRLIINYGDSTVEERTGQNGTYFHIYDKPGKYEVCLTTYCGSDSVKTDSIGHETFASTYCQFIIIGAVNSDSASCKAKFSYKILGDSGFVAVNITPDFSGSIVLDYGDGTAIQDSLVQGNKTYYHQYKKPGNYQVCLLSYCSLDSIPVSDKDSLIYSNSSSYCDWIKINSGDTLNPVECVAKFNYKINNRKVKFTNLSSGNYNKTLWSFGDGTFSDDSLVVHKYKKSGKYLVCLSIYEKYDSIPGDSIKASSSAAYCYANYCEWIEVGRTEPDDSVNCATRFKYAGHGEKVVFANATPPYFGKASWDFGDGSSAYGTMVTHKYSQPGKYYVCMTLDSTKQDSLTQICNPTYCEWVTVSGVSDSLKIDTNVDIKSVIAPNPIISSAYLKFEYDKSFDLFIYSNAGLLVKAYTNTNTAVLTISRDDLKEGLYFYTISSKSKILSRGKFFVR